MRKLGWLLLVVLALAIGAGMVFARTPMNMVNAKIPFSFYVGKTELPAGEYEVYQADDEAMDLVIRNLATGKAIVVPVLTRAISDHSGKPELVFEKVDDKSYLAKVFPAVVDGYELTDLRIIRAASAKGPSKATMSGE